jgi:hypothetical protein
MCSRTCRSSAGLGAAGGEVEVGGGFGVAAYELLGAFGEAGLADGGVHGAGFEGTQIAVDGGLGLACSSRRWSARVAGRRGPRHLQQRLGGFGAIPDPPSRRAQRRGYQSASNAALSLA